MPRSRCARVRGCAPLEQVSSERFKALVDTNFYDVDNVTRAALPIMRKQMSGYILQISSVGGRLAVAGNTAYHACKWAVGGFAECLAQEVAPFGVKVWALEPGGMRTNYGTRANTDTPDLLPDYKPSVGALVKMLKSYWGHENSDPAKVAQVVLRLAASDRLPTHLLLGGDAVQYACQAEASRAADAERWRETSVSTDIDAPRSLPACESERIRWTAESGCDDLLYAISAGIKPAEVGLQIHAST